MPRRSTETHVLRPLAGLIDEANELVKEATTPQQKMQKSGRTSHTIILSWAAVVLHVLVTCSTLQELDQEQIASRESKLFEAGSKNV